MIQWTEHPYYPIPTHEEAKMMGVEKLLDFHAAREESIYAEKTDELSTVTISYATSS